VVKRGAPNQKFRNDNSGQDGRLHRSFIKGEANVLTTAYEFENEKGRFS
jgi:hypothetical protein